MKQTCPSSTPHICRELPHVIECSIHVRHHLQQLTFTWIMMESFKTIAALRHDHPLELGRLLCSAVQCEEQHDPKTQERDAVTVIHADTTQSDNHH